MAVVQGDSFRIAIAMMSLGLADGFRAWVVAHSPPMEHLLELGKRSQL